MLYVYMRASIKGAARNGGGNKFTRIIVCTPSVSSLAVAGRDFSNENFSLCHLIDSSASLNRLKGNKSPILIWANIYTVCTWEGNFNAQVAYIFREVY